MMRSMTGFAAATVDDPRGAVSVTIRTVNHRFLDLQLRLPPALADLEPRVRALVQRGLARGRVELQVSLQPRGAAAPVVELNESFVTGRHLGHRSGARRRAGAGAADARRSAAAAAGAGDPRARTGVGRRAPAGPRPSRRSSAGRSTALDEMRAREGALLKADLGGPQAHARRPSSMPWWRPPTRDARSSRRGCSNGRASCRRRCRSIRPSLAQEVVRAAQRSDITEEVTRFRAHLEHWDALTDGDEPCGRKLDFLLQEMNREVNTIGSKADGLQVSEHIIDVKAELERMREQVQNVE